MASFIHGLLEINDYQENIDIKRETIRNGRLSDVNKELGVKSPHKREVEIAVPGGIKNHDIVGATPVSDDGSYKGYSIPNPFRK